MGHRGFRTGRDFGGIGPDSETLSDLVTCGPVTETNGNRTRVNEEIELDSTKEFDPLGPLDIGGFACLVNRSWGEGSGREGETTTTRTAEGILGAPGRRVLGSEVSFKSELKLDDGGGGIMDYKRTGEVGDGVGESDSDGRRHLEDED